MEDIKQKNILILSFYYPPDLCAGSFRMQAFSKALKKKQNCKFTVLTTEPNRYTELKQDYQQEHSDQNLLIRHFKIPNHKSGFVDQAKAFYYFYKQVMAYTKNKKYDAVFATSSRLFTAFLGARVANRAKAPLFLDIRDIFTETMDSLLKFPIKHCTAPIFKLVEHYTFSSARSINFVSAAFEPYFSNKLLANKAISHIPNGIDAVFYEFDFHSPEKQPKKKRVLYAGNIGQGQGLEKIIPKLAKQFEEHCEFIVIGGGGQKSALIEAFKQANLTNVSLLNPIPREQLLEEYKQADILFLHLNNHDAFKRVLPSKLFEYAATDKPILAGILGYSREFSQQEIEGCFTFDSCDETQAKQQLDNILSQPSITFKREKFLEKYNRDTLMDSLINKVLALPQ